MTTLNGPFVTQVKDVSPENLAGDLVAKGDPIFGLIWINPRRMSGAPCFYGSRVPIKTLFDYVESGYTLTEFVEHFEGVTHEQATGVLELARNGFIEGAAEGVKVLFDHCMPAPLRRSFGSHEVKTAAQMGWADLQNGKLLAAAAVEFEVMLTVDKNLRHQQNLELVKVAVVILDTERNTLEALLPLVPHVEKILPTLKRGQMVEIDANGKITEIRPGL